MNEQKKPLIIFDTDMDTDCDDAGALALMFEYVKRGKAELLGIIGDAPQAEVPGTCQLLCNYYGIQRPIGAVYGSSYPEEETDRYVRYRNHRKTLPDEIYYNKIMTRMAGKTDTDFLPSPIVYRQLLAGAPDKSVTILAIGFLTAIEQLFATGPDEISELTGLELFQKKVLKVVSMGCATFPSTGNYNFNYNMDRTGAKALFDKCPDDIPIYVSPAGATVVTGYSFTEKLELGHPLRTIYEIYNGGPGLGRSSWDLIALLFAMEPDNPIFHYDTHGTVRYDDSCNRIFWEENGPRTDYEMRPTISDVEMAELLEQKLIGEF